MKTSWTGNFSLDFPTGVSPSHFSQPRIVLAVDIGVYCERSKQSMKNDQIIHVQSPGFFEWYMAGQYQYYPISIKEFLFVQDMNSNCVYHAEDYNGLH